MVTLINLKKYPTHSDETFYYKAIVLYKEVRIAMAHNDGTGRPTKISPLPGDKFEAALKEATRYVKQHFGSQGFDLASYVDHLAHDIIDGREREKKLQKVNRIAKQHLIIVNKKEYADFTEGRKNDLFTYRVVHLKKSPKYFSEAQKMEVLSTVKLTLGEKILNEGWKK